MAVTSGNIVHDNNWVKRGFLYKTGPTETQFTISIKNNAAGGGGNDWVLDDIKLATCYPDLIMNPNDTISACAGYPVTITDTVKSFFNDYGYFMWEVSLNNGVSWVSLPTSKGFRTPVLENGLWVYHVDTVYIPSAADSGKLIRLKVASTSSNLTNSNCSVNNSQNVFLKIYSRSCSVLNAMLLNFSGVIFNNKASLQWTSKNENGLKEYDVEKSIDGINFLQIGKVSAVNDPGATYAFKDPEDISSIIYYRLKFINSDLSNIKYSKIISLHNKSASFKISTTNPFSNNLKIDVFLPHEGIVDFNLYDIYGNVINKKSLQLTTGNSQVLLDNLNGLTPGIYILRAFFDGIILQNKLIKAN
ncbi:MAG TPA: T9SS type A sorting domain-containing protein [Hanamia sp.]|nr:T9SS type A sorting domain-containing protein [Hanamia sp.]